MSVKRGGRLEICHWVNQYDKKTIRSFLSFKARKSLHGFQEQHIIRIDHGGVRRFAVCLPDGAKVKFLEGCFALLHVGECANPNEVIWAVEVVKLSDDTHASISLSQRARCTAVTRSGLTQRLWGVLSRELHDPIFFPTHPVVARELLLPKRGLAGDA